MRNATNRNAPGLHSAVNEAIDELVAQSARAELSTGRIVGQIRRLFPRIGLSDGDLAKAVASAGLRSGNIVHISDEPV